MKKFFANIKKYFRYAIRSSKAELKSEVADSYLNWLWWIIEPLCFMLIYVFVFGYIFKNNTPFFASFVFIGLTCWEFFNRMLTGSVKLIIGNRDLVTKVYIPKYILLLSKSFTWHVILIFPILAILYIFTFGLGLILMNLGVTINDLSNLTNIFLRMVFYLSGVFYNINQRLKGRGRLKYYLLRINPAAFFMNELRHVLLWNELPNFKWLGVWLVIGGLLCIYGIHLIHKNENSYAKVI